MSKFLILFVICLCYLEPDLALAQLRIVGQLKGFPEDHRIVLNAYQYNMNINLDEEYIFKTNKEGFFEFNTNIIKPQKYSIKIFYKNENDRQIFEQFDFWADNTEIEILANKGNLALASVFGSTTQDHYRTLLKPIYDDISNLHKLQTTILNLPDSLQYPIKTKYNKAVNNLDKAKIELLLNHPESNISAAELVYYTTFKANLIDSTALRSFYEQLSPLQQTNEYGRQLYLYLYKKLLPQDSLKFLNVPIDFALQNKDEHWVQLSQLKGKIILVDFWNLDTESDKDQYRRIYSYLYEAYHKDGLEIISVCIGSDKKDFYKKTKKIPWDVLWDEGGNISLNYQKIKSYPSNYLISNGRMFVKNLFDDPLIVTIRERVGDPLSAEEKLELLKEKLFYQGKWTPEWYDEDY